MFVSSVVYFRLTGLKLPAAFRCQSLYLLTPFSPPLKYNLPCRRSFWLLACVWYELWVGRCVIADPLSPPHLSLSASPGVTLGGDWLGPSVRQGAMVRRCAQAGVRRDVAAAPEDGGVVKGWIFSPGCPSRCCSWSCGAKRRPNALVAASAPGIQLRCSAQMPGCGRSRRVSHRKLSRSTWSTTTSGTCRRAPSVTWSTCGTYTCLTTASTRLLRGPCGTWGPSCGCWTFRTTSWGRPIAKSLAPLGRRRGFTTTPGTVTAPCRSWWRPSTWSPRRSTASSVKAQCGGWARGAGGKTRGRRESTPVSLWSNFWILEWTSAACTGRPPTSPCWWPCSCGSSWSLCMLCTMWGRTRPKPEGIWSTWRACRALGRPPQRRILSAPVSKKRPTKVATVHTGTLQKIKALVSFPPCIFLVSVCGPLSFIKP